MGPDTSQRRGKAVSRNQATKTALVSAAALVGSALFVSRILGFFRNSVIADLFGQNNITDAYNTAYLFPDTLYLILIGGAVSSALIPVIARYIHEQQEDEAWRVVSICFSATLVGMSAIILLGLIFAPVFVKLIAPGFGPAKFAFTVMLTRITILAILFHSLNGVLIGTEFSYNTFLATSIGPLVYNTTIIVMGVMLAPRLGIVAFAWATVVGAFLNFLIQLWGTWRLKPKFTWSLDIRHPGVRRIGRLMLPVMIGLSIAQINLLFNQIFLASLLPGGTINALVISSRIMLVPILVATSIGIALLPSLTREAVRQDRSAFRGLFTEAMRAVFFVSIPASVALIILAHPLIRILFQHGAFTDEATTVTAGALLFYSIGIVGYGTYEIISRAFFAMEDTTTPLKTGLISVGIGLILNLILIRLFSFRGLALAFSLTGFLNAGILLIALRRRIGRLGGLRLWDATWRTSVATLAMAAVLLSAGLAIAHNLVVGPPLVADLVQLLVPIALGIITFGAVARWLKMPELSLVFGILRRRLRPGHARAAAGQGGPD